ncbi:MAG: hypothetical protein K6E62_00935 [Lachnospiraceae bacterium]|nr:hypothetical protein [Lachnospiraceae bacterium]
MAVNGLTSGNTGITQVNASYEKITVSAEITKASVTAAGISSDAAVYEKSGNDVEKAVKEPKVDQETIDRLKAEADERHAQLKGLVEKLLLKQGGTWDNSQGLASLYRKLEVDEETRAQAQEDIAEDGYWGVEQTSDRILDFAKALAGTDPDMAEKMLDAIKEGFKQAGIEWGEDLPEISQKTMDATYKKVNDWISSLKGDSGSGSTAVAGAVSASVTSVKISASYTKATYSATTGNVAQAPAQEAEKPAEAAETVEETAQAEAAGPIAE